MIFDKKLQQEFGISWMRVKLILLNYQQKKAFKNAQGIIFLSHYAQNSIGKQVNLKGIVSAIINHGVSDNFRLEPKEQYPIIYYDLKKTFNFLYVSTIWKYKHHANVLMAIANLRRKNYPISITFVGNGEQKNVAKNLEQSIKIYDPKGEFVTWIKGVKLNEVISHYQKADAFVYASSCENMPNILIEAMSSGLPIASSSYEPMPEFLKDAGLYFDPRNVNEIESALEKMLVDTELRKTLSNSSYNYSGNFNWNKCANQTFSFLQKIGNGAL